jgi:hypothetical protein
MNRSVAGVSIVAVALMSLVLLATLRADHDEEGDSRVAQGFRIAPVRLTFQRKDRDQVGLGSYLVNAVAGCNDCHTCPSYAPGHNPYGPPFGPIGGGDGQINSTNYLAGGVPFVPPGVVSASLTPDPANGLPDGGHTLQQFKKLIRTGHDPDVPGRILQVMPWPIFRNMSDQDLQAIYLYLSAIPSAQPGSCVAPGQ